MNPKLKFLFGLILISLSLIAVYLAAYKYFGTFIRGWDGQMYYAQLRSIVVDRDLDFENELTRLTPHKEVFIEGYPKLPRTPQGRILNYFTFGWAFITLPPYILVHLICKAFCPVIASGYSPPYEIASSFWNLFLGILSIVFMALASLKLGISKKSTLLSLAGAIFATNVVYYVGVVPVGRHVALFSLIGGLTYCAIELLYQPQRLLLWPIVSVLTMMLYLVCPVDLIFLTIFIPAIYERWRSQRNSSFLIYPALMIIGIIFGVVIQSLVWRYGLGYWTLNAPADFAKNQGWVGLFDNVKQPKILEILFSPTQNGGWVYHPYYAIGILGLILASITSKERRSLWIAMLVSCFLYIIIYSCSHGWYSGASFGNRYFVSMVPFIYFGVSSIFEKLPRRAGNAFIVLISILIVWNLFLMANYIGKISILPNFLQSKLPHL